MTIMTTRGMQRPDGRLARCHQGKFGGSGVTGHQFSGHLTGVALDLEGLGRLKPNTARTVQIRVGRFFKGQATAGFVSHVYFFS